MRFNVEDFEVVADGRCLEQVSTGAGTKVVHVGGGSILSSEVANRIAIPSW